MAEAARWSRWWYLVVALGAVWPRAHDLGRFATGDELLFWLPRSHQFATALMAGDFAATALSTHPGVTTMWLGWAGIRLGEALAQAGLIGLDAPMALLMVRLPAALVNAACVVLGYGLLRRLVPRAALLAALLWAWDPFIVAYSTQLHVDALMGSWLTISVLGMLLAAQREWHAGWLVLSALSGALAVLSKSPGMVVLPLGGLVGLLWLWHPTGVAPASRVARARLLGRAAALWLLVAGAALLLCWPALWAAPQGVWQQLRAGVEAEAASPHMRGNFFLGQPDAAPGWLFYPVALALRSTPLSLAGIVLAALAWRHATITERRVLAVLAALAIGLCLGLSLFDKKLNRYIEPAFAALDILAAVGWLGIMPRRPRGTTLLIGALAAVNLAGWHPYPIAAFNQLLGGSPAGARTFLVGTGEGLEQVAAYLGARDDIGGVVTVAPIARTVQWFMPPGARVIDPADEQLPHKAGYVVVYRRQLQFTRLPGPYADVYQRGVALRTFAIHGVPYAWVYQVPPATRYRYDASFAATLRLVGAEPVGAAQPGGALRLQLVWQPQQVPIAATTVFLHMVDAAGARVAQSDMSLDTDDWEAGAIARSEFALPLPADLAAGTYQIFLGTYDPATGARYPLVTAATLDPARSGADALPLFVWSQP
jgi:4-amino-4-deoxy-L-arabinose transferase-like glycosyltransferase